MSKIVRFVVSVSMALAVAALGVGATGAVSATANSASGRCPGGFTWDGFECVPNNPVS